MSIVLAKSPLNIIPFRNKYSANPNAGLKGHIPRVSRIMINAAKKSITPKNLTINIF